MIHDTAKLLGRFYQLAGNRRRYLRAVAAVLYQDGKSNLILGRRA